MMITSWNVNSLNVRLPHVLRYLSAVSPLILGVQELKQTTEAVDVSALAQAGYHSAVFGQKTYNGVAIFSQQPLENIVKGIPHFPDRQARALAATCAGVRILNLYIPNGKAIGDDKYFYKLQWLDAVYDYIVTEMAREARLVVIGDFNIAPSDMDLHDPAAWRNKILCSPPERAFLTRLQALGLVDAFRLKNPRKQQFSWWDYRGGAYSKNHGLRIDFTLCSPALKIVAAGIDSAPRGWTRPSDHAPTWVKLAL